jgi:hypothetical protein
MDWTAPQQGLPQLTGELRELLLNDAAITVAIWRYSWLDVVTP